MILHVDMDAYFATLEQQWNPALRGKPIIVCGKGSGERTVVATASYEAKRLGIKTAMAVWQAKKICPRAILVPAHYHKYIAATKQLIAIFESFTPDVEIFSIDEAFLKIENCQLKIARLIKNRIKREIGELCTCSVGIAPNKLLAKIASEYQKPDGLTVIGGRPLRKNGSQAPQAGRRPRLPEGLRSNRGHIFFQGATELLKFLKLDDIPGIGPRINERLNKMGIKTVSDLQNTVIHNLLFLIQEFGSSYAEFLKRAAFGIDNSPLVRYREAPDEKSFGHSYTLPKKIYTLTHAKAFLLHLAEKVGARMRQKNFYGRTVHIWLRFTDMSEWGKQITLDQPTNDGLEIFSAGESLIESSKRTEKSENWRRRIRAVGISCSNLTKTKQNLLFVQDRNKTIIPRLLDTINHKYGENTLLRAETLPILDIFEDIPDGRNSRQFSTIK